MDHEEYVENANYWNNKDKDSKKMNKDELKISIDTYILNNNTCALATGYNDFIRCTPIEYTYYNNYIYMFSEGGEKFIGLENNKNVCIAIFDKYKGFGELKGMQIMGTLEIVEVFSEEYIELINVKKYPLEAFKKMEHPMNLLKVKLNKIIFLNSDFSKNWYASRQILEV